MTKKIQYRDPSSSEWKDITYEDIGAASKSSGEAVKISSFEPPTEPGNNKIYIYDTKDKHTINEHSIFVKKLFNSVVHGPYIVHNWTDLQEYIEGEGLDPEHIYFFDSIEEEFRKTKIYGTLTYGNWGSNDIYIQNTATGNFSKIASSLSLTITWTETYKLKLQYVFDNSTTGESYSESISPSELSKKNQVNRTQYIGYILHTDDDRYLFMKDALGAYVPLIIDTTSDIFYANKYYEIITSSDSSYKELTYKDFGLKRCKRETITEYITPANNITIDGAWLYQWGRIAQLEIHFIPNENMSTNSYKDIGTLTQTKYYPMCLTLGGNRDFMAHITSSGHITGRNLGSQILANSSVIISFTYITLPDIGIDS